MKSRKEIEMKQIACHQCKKIFEKRKHIKPDPKYCTRTCYAQALKLPPVEEPKVEQVDATRQDQCMLSINTFLVWMLCGVIAVIVGGFFLVNCVGYLWS